MDLERGAVNGNGRGRLAAAVAAAAFLLSIVVRLTTWGDVFRDGTPRVPPFDDQYHALRIVRSALHFPEVLEFDPDRGVSGAFCPWPPGYDLLAGGLARLLGGTTEDGVLARAVWFPVLVGSAFLAFLSYRAIRRHGPLAGVAATLALVLSAPLVWVSGLGNVDHHFLEAPLLLGIVAAVGGAARAGSAAAGVRSGLLLAAALAASLFVESAFLFAAALAFLALMTTVPRGASALGSGAVGFGATALLVAAYRLTRPPGYPESEWFLGTPHAAALGAAAVSLGAAALFERRGESRLTARALAVLLGAAAAAAVPRTLEAYADGVRYFGGDPSLATISELEPLVFGSSAPVTDLLLLGGGGLLALLFVADAVRIGRPDRRAQAVLVLGYLIACFSSRRFLVTAVPLLVLAGAAAVAARVRSPRKDAAWAAATLLSLPAILGAWVALRNPGTMETPATGPFERAARFLSAEPGAPGRVLAPFSWGHLLHRLGRRPVLVDPFGAMPDRRLFDEAVASTLITREGLLAAWCRTHGVRYIVLDNPLARITFSAESLGIPPSVFLRPGAEPSDPPVVTRFAQATFWWRAYFGRGAPFPPAGRRGATFRHFRLAWADSASSGFPEPYSGPALQIWEPLEPQ